MFDTGDLTVKQVESYLKKKDSAIEKYETVTGNSIESLFDEWHHDKELYERIVDKTEDTGPIGVDYRDQLENIRIACKKLSDKRNSRVYMITLITGWIIEDAVVHILQNLGMNAKLNGADADRKFLKNPSKEPDIKLNSGKLELKSDNDGYCKNTGFYDLKKDSYESLREGDIVLVRHVQSQEYFVFTKESCTVLGDGTGYGGKPTKEIEVPAEERFELQNLKSEISKFV